MADTRDKVKDAVDAGAEKAKEATDKVADQSSQAAHRPPYSLALPCELLELDPLGDQAVGAQAALLVLFVGFEVAFEPVDLAVAFEGQDVGGQAVEEEAVVADHHGAAGEVLQRAFKGAQGLDIEIVGGLVEQDDVAACR